MVLNASEIPPPFSSIQFNKYASSAYAIAWHRARLGGGTHDVSQGLCLGGGGGERGEKGGGARHLHEQHENEDDLKSAAQRY